MENYPKIGKQRKNIVKNWADKAQYNIFMVNVSNIST